MSSNVPSTTRFVEADSGGFYTPPERPFDRIRAITSHLQPVDGNGFDRPRAKPDASVTELVSPPAGAPPTMADALAAAAEAVGADLPTLLDSQSFCAAITPVSPLDQAGLQDVLRAHMPAPATPRMAPNPAQGAPGSSAPGPSTGSVLERMKAQAEKSLDQPSPPGSTVA
ncbi:MAG TPA: hypothetical protein VNH38_02170 [Candidatus Dormibacteraeota bacterium]|nr:hypothetical protein [Candidatus Dormibacteraeota bacterium]